MRRSGRVVAAGCIVVLAGCVNGVAYPDASGPRFAGPAPGGPDASGPSSDEVAPLVHGTRHSRARGGGSAFSGGVRVVSYNVEEGRAWPRALRALRAEPAMAAADIVLLQEMEERGVAAMARALDMHWVYYPAMARGGERRHFGNAVLSRWPITDDDKLVLPHPGVFVRTLRTATAATVAAPGGPLRVYSVHLGTPLNTFRRHRRAQFAAVLDHAAPHRRVVIGGDLNGTEPVGLALARGYRWPTEEGPNTLWIGRWDHVLVRGLDAPATGAGTGDPPEGVSDHRPVWATLLAPGAACGPGPTQLPDSTPSPPHAP
jgi:endonuclease/exonuclease/phosphatase family metal-dependent hydrolase